MLRRKQDEYDDPSEVLRLARLTVKEANIRAARLQNQTTQHLVERVKDLKYWSSEIDRELLDLNEDNEDMQGPYMDCGSEPDIIPSILTRCGEIPLCRYVYCYKSYACLLDQSISYVYYGCRTVSTNQPYYCVCHSPQDKPKLKLGKLLTTNSLSTLITKMNNISKIIDPILKNETDKTLSQELTKKVTLDQLFSKEGVSSLPSEVDLFNNETATTLVHQIRGFMSTTVRSLVDVQNNSSTAAITFSDDIMDDESISNISTTIMTTSTTASQPLITTTLNKVVAKVNESINVMASDLVEKSTTTEAPSSGLSGGAIAGIVVGAILLFLIAGLAFFFVRRTLSQRRKTHGVYSPQQEEAVHAKDLPYLPRPTAEGLI